MKSLAVAISLAAVLCSANATSLRSQIDASNKAVQKLMMAKDVNGFKNYMKGYVTSDFKYVEAGRSMDFDKMCAGMAMGLGQMKKMIKAEAKLVTLKEKGNTATAITTRIMEGTVLGGDHKTHTMAFIGKSADSFVKQGGKWKMSKMSWLGQTMTMDGKSMNARMSAAPMKK